MNPFDLKSSLKQYTLLCIVQNSTCRLWYIYWHMNCINILHLTVHNYPETCIKLLNKGEVVKILPLFPNCNHLWHIYPYVRWFNIPHMTVHKFPETHIMLSYGHEQSPIVDTMYPPPLLRQITTISEPLERIKLQLILFSQFHASLSSFVLLSSYQILPTPLEYPPSRIFSKPHLLHHKSLFFFFSNGFLDHFLSPLHLSDTWLFTLKSSISPRPLLQVRLLQRTNGFQSPPICLHAK